MDSRAKQLFDEGMRQYTAKNYKSAIKKLSLAVDDDPANGEYLFYLGLCYLLDEQTNDAIQKLEKAANISQGVLLGKCYWYLGNAYLLKGDVKNAMEMFNKVVDMELVYEVRTRDLIDKLTNMR